MKGRYIIITAVLLLCAVFYLAPASEGADAADHPESYNELTDPVAIGSDYMAEDLPLQYGGSGNGFNIKTSATGGYYIGYFDNQLFLVLRAPVWESGEEATLPVFTLRYDSVEYTFSAVTLDNSNATASIKLGTGLRPTLEPFIGGVYLNAANGNIPLVSKSYCLVDTESWVIYDQSVEKFVGSALIKNHAVTMDTPSKLTLGNGVYGLDFQSGPLTFSTTSGGVTYSMAFQPMSGGTPVADGAYSISIENNFDYPLKVSHNNTTGTYSMQVLYADSTGGSTTVTYNSVQNYKQSISFDVTDKDSVNLGDSGSKDKAISVANTADTPDFIYGGWSSDPVYRYYPATDDAEDIIVTTSPGSESYQELSLLNGSIELRDGAKIRCGVAVVGAGDATVIVRAGNTNDVTVPSQGSFTINSGTYINDQAGARTYALTNLGSSNEEIHGIKLATGQQVTLGNGAIAFYDVTINTVNKERAIRNENSPDIAAKSLTAIYTDATTPLTVTSGDTGLFVASYILSNEQLNDGVCRNIIGTPYEATVSNETGEFSGGQDEDVIILEAGQTLSLSTGTKYTAVTRSVFTGTGDDVVLESGQVNITSGDLTITIRLPDGSAITVTGASQIALGETSSFTVPAGDVSFGNLASYTAVTESYFVLENGSELRLANGRITVPQNGYIAVHRSQGNIILTATSGGEIQSNNNGDVSIYSGAFTITGPSDSFTMDVSLMATGTSLTYRDSTFTYYNGQADLDIYSGYVRLVGYYQSVSFEGETLTATRIYRSVGGPATISSGDSSTACPTLVSGTIRTYNSVMTGSGITFSSPHTVDYTVTSAGVVTVGSYDRPDVYGINAMATISSPQGSTEYELEFYNNSSTDDMVISFAVGSELTATLESGPAAVASGTSITVAGAQYTSTINGSVIRNDSGTAVVESGTFRASSYTWNGVDIVAENGTFLIDISNGRIRMNAQTQIKFRGEDTIYVFPNESSFKVLEGGKVLVISGNLLVQQGACLYLGSDGRNYRVDVLVAAGYVTIQYNLGVAGLQDGDSVKVTHPDGNGFTTVTRNGGSSNVSFSLGLSDAQIAIEPITGNTSAATLELNGLRFTNGVDFYDGLGSVSVRTTSTDVTTTYVSGEIHVTGSISFDGVSVQGDEMTVTDSQGDPVVTIPVSATATVAPDSGEPAVYVNASSSDDLQLTYSRGTMEVTQGEYYRNANIWVSLGGCNVKLVSNDDTDTFVVGVDSGGFHYVILSNGQDVAFQSFDEGTTFKYTAAADNTKFGIYTSTTWDAYLLAGAASFGSGSNRNTLTLADDSRTLTYTSTTGAIISTFVDDYALYGRLDAGSATIPADAGTTLFVAGTEYLAGNSDATMSISSDGTKAYLDGGSVCLDDGESVIVDGVIITNLGDPDPDLHPTIAVDYDSSTGTRTVFIEVSEVTVKTLADSSEHTFTSTDGCEVTVGDDGRFYAHDGTFDLNDGEELLVGNVTITSSGISSIGVAGGVITVNSGSVTFSSAANFTVSRVPVTGAVAASVSDTVTTVSAPFNGTVTFDASGALAYSYTNASSDTPLVLSKSSGSSVFTPLSGKYFLNYGDTATLNGMTLSVRGSADDRVIVDVDNGTVTVDNGKTVAFTSDTTVSCTSAADGTVISAPSLAGLALSSGSLSLVQDQSILIGGSAYTAASADTVISSVSGSAVLVSGSVSFVSGSTLKVWSSVFTSASATSTISAASDIATLTDGTVTYSSATLYLGSVPVTHSGAGTFSLSVGGSADLAAGDTVTTTGGNSITAQSGALSLSIGNTGIITVVSGTVIIHQGQSMDLDGTTFAAVTDVTIDASGGKYTMESGSATLSAQTPAVTQVTTEYGTYSGLSAITVSQTGLELTIPAGVAANLASYQVTAVSQSVLTYSGSAGYGLVSGEVTVSDLALTAAGVQYSISGTATVAMGSGDANLTLKDGSISVPQNGAVTISGVTYTASSSGTRAAVSGGAVTVAGSFTLTSPSAVNVSSIYLDDATITVGQNIYSGSSVGLSITNGVATLSSTDVWATFRGSIVIAGTMFASVGESYVSSNGTWAEFGSGSTVTFSDASVRMGTFSLTAGSTAVTVGYENDHVVLTEGEFTAGSTVPLTVGSSNFTVDSGVTVSRTSSSTTFTMPGGTSVSYPAQSGGSSVSTITLTYSGTGNAVFVHESLRLSLPSGGSASFDSNTVSAGSGGSELTLSTPVELNSGTLALSDGQSVQIAGHTYVSAIPATVSYSSGIPVLENGGLYVPQNAAVTIGGVTYMAGTADARVTISSGTVTVVGGFTLTSASAVNVSSISLDGATSSVTVGQNVYSGSGAGMSITDGVATLTTTDVWASFQGMIVVAGTEFTSVGQASVSTDLTHAMFRSGSTVTFSGAEAFMGSYSVIAGSTAATVGYDGTYVVLTDGSFTAGENMPLTVGSAQFSVDSDVIISYASSRTTFTLADRQTMTYYKTVSSTVTPIGLSYSGSGNAVFVYEDLSLTLPSEGTATVGTTDLRAGNGGAEFTLSSPAELTSGTAVITNGETLTVAGNTYTAGSSATVSYSSGVPVLEEGMITLASGSSVSIGGVVYTSEYDGTTIGFGSGTTVLENGCIAVSGSFSLSAGTTISGTGSASYHIIYESSFVKYLIESGSNVSATMGGNLYSGISEATLTLEGSGDVKLHYGSVVLDSGEVTVPNETGTGTSASYIKFDGASGTVRVHCISGGVPMVELSSGASVNLTDAVDPTYSNPGNEDTVFYALSSTKVSLDSGSIIVPEGSTVYIGEKEITNHHGAVTVSSNGDITLGPSSRADVTILGETYTIENTSTTESMSTNVDSYVEDSSFTEFERTRTECIRFAEGYMRAGMSQKVRALASDTVRDLEAAVYDRSVSLGDNCHRLWEMVQALEAAAGDQATVIAQYLETVVQKIENLHVGETSTSEQYMIENARTAAESIINDQTLGDSEKVAKVDKVYADLEKELGKYRSTGSASFNVYRSVLLVYVDTEPEDGFTEITDLKAQYASALNDIQYLANLNSDQNIQRLDELREAFEGAVYNVHSAKFEAVKNGVLAEMKGLYTSYGSVTAKDLIDSAVAKVNVKAYDAKRPYADNVNLLNNLLSNLKLNLSTALSGNVSTFEAYRTSILERYDITESLYQEKYDDPGISPTTKDRIEEVLGLIRNSRTVVEDMSYDANKTLNENLNAVFQEASDLEATIDATLDQQLTNELERVYTAALAHIALNDRDGVPSKLREYITATRTALQEEYNSAHTAAEKGTNINTIMETYNTEMKVLIERAEFYLNIDVGIKFLNDRYASSYPAVVTGLATRVAALKATEYDPAKDMSQNLADLQEKVNTCSVDLATIRLNATRADFEDYREFQAWTVAKNATATSSEAETNMANEYAAKIRAVEFNNRSIESNRYAVDRIVQEFDEKHSALVAAERKGDFDAVRQTLIGNVDAAMQADDNNATRNAASDAKSRIQGFVYDLSLTYDENVGQLTKTADIAIQHIRYVRVSAYAPSTAYSSEDPSNAMFHSVAVAINDAVVPDNLTALKSRSFTEIYNAIVSDKTQAEKVAIIEQAERNFYLAYELLGPVEERIAAEQVLEDSDAAKKIIANARTGVLAIAYDLGTPYKENLAKVDTYYKEFRTDLREQRLLDNSTTVGAIRADGRAIDGGVAEYPAGTEEIWGIVANENGLGDGATATITRVYSNVDLDGGSSSPASGSTVAVLGNGKLLGGFDVTLYNEDEQVTAFSGTYRVKILLPADMRGYDSMQVAYVDEYGDVQVYDARVEGNYLVFETVHFSTFYVVGLLEQHRHYDAYAYAAIVAAFILIMVYLIRVVRLDANGGTGRSSVFVFLGDGEGSLPAAGYSREGYELAGWSRDREGSEIIPASAELSSLGKIHFLKLYAVWQKKEGEN